MSTPELNPVGYHNSSVHAMEGFKHMDFALAHGSGDDNGEAFLSFSRLGFRLTCLLYSPLSQHSSAVRSPHECSRSVRLSRPSLSASIAP
jgi:hypothetical protein